MLRELILKLLSSHSATRLLEDTLLDVQPVPLNAPPGFSLNDVPRRPGARSVDGPIFISSRFRSGSTLLWRFFRESNQFTAYYEPLNPRRWFDLSTRGDRVDSSHRGVSNYWREYEPLTGSSVPWSERWSSHDLYLTPFSPSSFIKDIISGVMVPRGIVSVPSTSNKARIRGLAGAILDRKL